MDDLHVHRNLRSAELSPRYRRGRVDSIRRMVLQVLFHPIPFSLIIISMLGTLGIFGRDHISRVQDPIRVKFMLDRCNRLHALSSIHDL